MATKKNSEPGSLDEPSSPKVLVPRAKAANVGARSTRSKTTANRKYTDLSVASFQHPADRAATAALAAIPGLDTVVRWLIEQGYERALYQQNLATSVRIGPKQLPDLNESFVRVLTVLDLPGATQKPPALYVGQNPALNAMTIGSQTPLYVKRFFLICSHMLFVGA